MLFRLTCLGLALLATSFAQLTPDQKVVELRQLAGLYARMYGPIEWKKQALRYDLTDLAPWTERVRNSKDDLEFLEIMGEYVSRLEDGHDIFTMRSGFAAQLAFSVDIYDGRFLIDRIIRSALPVSRFPAAIGDELVSLDDKTPEEWVKQLRQYSVTGLESATRREAASLITFRPQVLIPRAHEVGATAKVVVRRQNGATETYTVPWVKFGEPVTRLGPVTPPFVTSRKSTAITPSTTSLLRQLTNWKRQRPDGLVLGVGSVPPIFQLPDNFRLRSGGGPFDTYYSGTFERDGKRIGFLRIADFADTFPLPSQLRSEMQFMEANTDGLIVDVMRNPGGFGDNVALLASFLVPQEHSVLGFELRANSLWVQVFSDTVAQLKLDEAPEEEIAAWEQFLEEVQRANRIPLGRTKAIPLDGGFELSREPYQFQGRSWAYTKPLIVLTDEYSASAADAFPAVIQDNQRGIIVGKRTMGLGGSVIEWPLEGSCECSTRITVSLMVRKQPVNTGGEFPTAPYVENIGVRPNVEIDYMTTDNLLNNGRPFVEAVTQAMLEHIAKNQQ